MHGIRGADVSRLCGAVIVTVDIGFAVKDVGKIGSRIDVGIRQRTSSGGKPPTGLANRDPSWR
jgi:hypothetical protein